MTISLPPVPYGDGDYVTDFETWRTTITDALNELFGLVGGGGVSGSIPEALKAIFDRRGIIGIGSYDFNEGTLSGPDYNLSVQPGHYWSGSLFYSKASAFNVSLSGQSTGTKYIGLDSTGKPILQTTPDGTTTRSFYWNATSHVVSSKALYTGVSILFDGDDYADMLTSAAKSKSFDSVAQRLEEVEQGQDIFGGYYAQDTPHSGLNFKYKAGKVRNDSTITDTAAGQVALTDNTTNYVELDPATGVVSKNTVGFTSGKIPLYTALTASGAITTVTDKRTPAIAGTGGGGGGHTQNTDQGTSQEFFETDMDAAGNPTTRTGLKMIKGDGASGYAAIALNRATMELEKTLDSGATWEPLSSLEDLDLGGQEQSKVILEDDPPRVLQDLGRGSSADYEDVDLSSYLDAPNGIHGAIIRVRFWDSSPGSDVNLLLKRKGATGAPLISLSSWDGQYHLQEIVIGVESTTSPVFQFFVNASGTDTANVEIYLVGYFKVVQGVGTQRIVYTFAGNAVAASTTTLFNLTGFCNRGSVVKIKVQETGSVVTGLYDVGVYSKDTCGGTGPPAVSDADKKLILTNIDPTLNGRVYENWLLWDVEDEDDTKELHLKIRNQDASNQGTYTVTLTVERFA